MRRNSQPLVKSLLILGRQRTIVAADDPVGGLLRDGGGDGG
jgi:hypothetical protein